MTERLGGEFDTENLLIETNSNCEVGCGEKSLSFAITGVLIVIRHLKTLQWRV